MSAASIPAVWAQLRTLPEPPSLSALFRDDPRRSHDLVAEGAGLRLDYSRQSVTREALQALLQLAEQAALRPALQALMDGAVLNITEQRAATHVQLRQQETSEALARWHWADAVRRGDYRSTNGQRITDVVNIGIGGSHLGPALAVSALSAADDQPLRCHFISNIDPQPLDALLPQLPADSTLWIVSSKSLSTQETRVNAEAAFRWMDQHAAPGWRARQLVVVTANAAAAAKLQAGQVFMLDDSVGGRYSLWSAVDLPVALALGSDTLRALHAGARTMDTHALDTDCAGNLPALLALTGLWNRNRLQRPSLAVIPYDSRLELLPDYLQQLVMESNGKGVQQDGSPVQVATSPVLWGSVGTNGQHSFHQCLHQGTDTVPVEFLVPVEGRDGERHDYLIANALAQSHALAFGSDSPLAPVAADARLAPHKHMPGNRPSSLLFYRRLDAFTLGRLIALYEHKTFFESRLWNINPFDQWGVELGKGISNRVYDALRDPAQATGLPADLAASLDSVQRLRR